MNKMAASENLYGPNNFISKAEAMISKKRKGHRIIFHGLALAISSTPKLSDILSE